MADTSITDQIVTPLTVKGGVTRVIDSATGGITQTGSGFIENEKFAVYQVKDTGTATGQFTTDGTLGRKVANVVCGTTSRARFILGMNGGTQATQAVPALTKYAIPVLPNTTYIYTAPLLYSNFPSASGAIVQIDEINSAGSRVVLNTVIKGAGVTSVADYTNYSKTFTTSATTTYLVIGHGSPADSDNINLSLDVMGITLNTVSTITNTSSVPALFYPKVTAVTSTDNIDQSQVVSANTLGLGLVGSKYRFQSFLPTKKNLTGYVFQRGVNAGTYAGAVTVSIQGDSAGKPNGVDLITPQVISNATWNGYSINTDITITFPKINLTIDGSTIYHFVATSSTADDSNFTRFVVSSTANPYSGGVFSRSPDFTTWTAETNDMYFKTLYSKNTDNFTVSTGTETVSVTAPTTDGWANGTVIDTSDGTYGITPLTLTVGANSIYLSSNGPATADGEVDPSLQGIFGGRIHPIYPSRLAKIVAWENKITPFTIKTCQVCHRPIKENVWGYRFCSKTKCGMPKLADPKILLNKIPKELYIMKPSPTVQQLKERNPNYHKHTVAFKTWECINEDCHK